MQQSSWSSSFDSSSIPSYVFGRLSLNLTQIMCCEVIVAKFFILTLTAKWMNDGDHWTIIASAYIVQKTHVPSAGEHNTWGLELNPRMYISMLLIQRNGKYNFTTIKLSIKPIIISGCRVVAWIGPSSVFKPIAQSPLHVLALHSHIFIMKCKRTQYLVTVLYAIAVVVAAVPVPLKWFQSLFLIGRCFEFVLWLFA